MDYLSTTREDVQEGRREREEQAGSKKRMPAA
jgi:hypothetical protein